MARISPTTRSRSSSVRGPGFVCHALNSSSSSSCLRSQQFLLRVLVDRTLEVVDLAA
jgi:hypothetical protein